MYRLKEIFLFAYIISFTLSVFSQNRSFPVHMAYSDCIKPTNVSQFQMDSTISQFYWYWKDKYVEPAGSTPGGYYIKSGGGTGGSDGLVTISEAHGYGMLIFALMGGDDLLADNTAKEYFDGMYYLYNDHRSNVCEELMSWEILTDGFNGESDVASSAATDGDMDIAYALMLAHYQWGSSGAINYLSEAERIVTKGIKEFETNPDNHRTMLGDWVYYYDEWSWSWEVLEEYSWATRSSDWMVGHLKAYEDLTNDSYWGAVRDTVYSMIEQFVPNHSSKTGLLSDFIDSWNTEPASEFFLDEFKETNQYYQNACRTPLRFIADWAHNERTEVKPFLNKILNWLKTETNNQPADILFGYNIETGEPLFPDSVSMCFTAPLVAACIVDSSHQQYLNNGWSIISKSREHYYPDCLNLLSMLMISGNWWAPIESLPVDTVVPITSQKTLVKSKIAIKNLNKTIQIVTDGINLKSEDLLLVTLSGKKVKMPLNKISKGHWMVDLSSMAKGNYILKISTEGTKLFKNVAVVD